MIKAGNKLNKIIPCKTQEDIDNLTLLHATKQERGKL